MFDVNGIYTYTNYDLFGNVMGATDGNGVSSSVTTNSSTDYAAPSQITVGTSLTTTMTYNSFLGLTAQTGPNGTSVDIGYDTNARPTSSTSPFGATTSTAYTDSSSGSTCTMVDNRWTQTNLDGLGRPVRVSYRPRPFLRRGNHLDASRDCLCLLRLLALGQAQPTMDATFLRHEQKHRGHHHLHL